MTQLFLHQYDNLYLSTEIVEENGVSTLEICDLSMADMECYNCLGVNSEGNSELESKIFEIPF